MQHIRYILICAGSAIQTMINIYTPFYKMDEILISEGREKEALTAAIKLLSQYMTEDEILRTLNEMISRKTSKLTEEDVENKNYTFVSVSVEEGDRVITKRFLVSSPYKDQALSLAKIYTERQGWDLKNVNSPYEPERYYDLYPRNYIVDARKLYAEGKYL